MSNAAQKSTTRVRFAESPQVFSSSSSPTAPASTTRKMASGAATGAKLSPATSSVKAGAAATPAASTKSCAASAGAAPSTKAEKKVAAWLEKSAWEKWIRSEFPESKLVIRCMSLGSRSPSGCVKAMYSVETETGGIIGDYMGLVRGETHQRITVSTKPMQMRPHKAGIDEMMKAGIVIDMRR